jgi:hypothetical protein
MTRTITLNTTWAGPEGVREGGTHTLPKEIAKGLVDTRQAEYADGLPPETAVAASAPQKAVISAPEVAAQAKGQSAASKPSTEPPASPVQAQPDVKINLQAPAGWGAK